MLGWAMLASLAASLLLLMVIRPEITETDGTTSPE